MPNGKYEYDCFWCRFYKTGKTVYCEKHNVDLPVGSSGPYDHKICASFSPSDRYYQSANSVAREDILRSVRNFVDTIPTNKIVWYNGYLDERQVITELKSD